ncbi:MAG: hypothetical protein ACK4PR_14060, partial [Gammaproteobacteria bacterium]
MGRDAKYPHMLQDYKDNSDNTMGIESGDLLSLNENNLLDEGDNSFSDDSNFLFEDFDLFAEQEVFIHSGTLENSMTPPVELSQDNPIIVNNDHICAVRFIQEPTRWFQLPGFFTGAADWKGIPSFVVLTGINGSGKSLILNYLFKLYNDKMKTHKSNKIIYIGPEVVLFNQDTFNAPKDTSYDIKNPESFQKLLNECEIYQHAPLGEEPSKYVLAILN